MLLIDLHRNAISQSHASIRVPFVFERVGGNPTAAKALLARLRQGPTLVRALFSELSTHAGSSLNAPNNANRVLEDAARAIASGALLVGRQLPADFKLVLIPEQSAQNLGLDTVIFLTNKIARDFSLSSDR